MPTAAATTTNVQASGEKPSLPDGREVPDDDALAVITALLLVKAPEESVTVRVTTYVPADTYVWEGFWRELVVRSPKSHSNECAGSPPEVVALKDTVSGTMPRLGVAEMVAVRGPNTRIWIEVVADSRAVSVTVIVATKTPSLV